ncbi:MAG TPA: aspartyl/asparaginyl beta-hydroxylase domain-containing protein, partial [Flavobacteriaceae bacterium]|nr:aspartyl/asparaginyl beta-hydroxylase domain-containing protein [Flavobacteriaceae bacterium]
YTNVNLPHSVTNTGSTNRVHLVLDCIRNEWSDKLFASVGFDFTQEIEVAEQYTESTKKRMIEELELQGTPASKKLIIQLKQGTS